MQVRLANARDLRRLTEIATTSLIDDPTYDYLSPYRQKYPEDNSTWMRLRLESHLYSPRSVFLVVELDNSREQSFKPDGKEQDGVDMSNTTSEQVSIIVSFGIWIRFGDDEAARKRIRMKNSWLNLVDNTTTTISTWSLNHKFTRRDASPARMQATERETGIVKKEFFSASPNWWSLELLVTDRNYRRRGAATKVVTWATSIADGENVFCGIEASPMGFQLYEACGFEKLAAWHVMVPGEKESLEYYVMRRDPATPNA